MGEVDELDDAVDHGVAKGDQRIHPAEGEAVNQLLEKKLDIHVHPNR